MNSKIPSLPPSRSYVLLVELPLPRLLGVGSCSGCLYAYVVRSGIEGVSRLYPHASTALALRPLPLARAVLAGAGALVATFTAIAYALDVPVQDVASAVLRGEGAAGSGSSFAF